MKLIQTRYRNRDHHTETELRQEASNAVRDGKVIAAVFFLSRTVSRMSVYDLVSTNKPCMDGDRFPKPSAVQELVAAWKVLWKWRKRN
jgi:hypothetical protein